MVPSLSVEPAALRLTTVPLATVWLAGVMAATGALLAATVRVTEVEVLAPSLSVTVRVTVWVALTVRLMDAVVAPVLHL